MSGGGPSRSAGKRPRQEDDDDDNPNQNLPAKRERFPKKKKGKQVDVVVEKVITEENVNDLSNPIVAAKERVKRRNQITAELLSEENGGVSISAAEVTYEDNEDFVDDGIQIEPFNLDKEREEGYFDASGNFVEYVRENEIKDAWLDNVEVDPRYAALSSATKNDEEEEEVQELSSKDVAIMKRRIADVLESEETVLQCLRRLKGSGDRKTKMSGETKIVFDQLTEDASKLMENGEYNVYHESKEVFEREAEGYEKLARARGEGTSTDTPNPPLASADDFDMFADDDEHAAAEPSTVENNAVSEPPSDAINSGGALQSDYVYDESSGYYYSSSLGYYYDPNTGLYCSAESGKWYSFNEETGAYAEVNEVASNLS
ncbi:uncharacterized protein LOC131645100 isoform X2 [Vicia villosa]|uniref:uncharacterized protein LOC131645100 isoform X2 n=1 Tax=Vicia villosa TaxID=3911 RepID=UPI00273AC01A|nr:uncharacterized protein LOC131645100 isoform X2 [Vicia villosa]